MRLASREPRILYIQYTNPAAYPPLEHSSRFLAAMGWRVVFLGVRIPQTDRIELAPNPRIAVHHLGSIGTGWRQRLHYVTYAAWVLVWTLLWRPRLIYASDPLVCPIVLLLSFIPGLAVVYHEHDSPQPPTNTSVRERLKSRARRALARRAWLRVLPNETRAVHFRSSVVDREPTLCVWNCPRRDEVGPPRLDQPGGALRVLYHGSIVPSRLPLHLLQALRGLPVTLEVIGYETQGHFGYVQELLRYARSLGVADRVQVRPAMRRHELMVLSRTADIGLSFMPAIPDDQNLRWMAGASNKPFDYLAAGMAVLVSDLPEWRRMYVDPGYGLACRAEDPHDVASAFRWLVDHPVELRAMGERGRQRIVTDWNYETQFAPVIEWLTNDVRVVHREVARVQ
jgi:glycosyltransferase involved in cell wall biosynthesis